MRIAIVGAGFAGLAAAWQLSQVADVTLYDPRPVGKSSSGMASGLLHPYPGRKSRRAPDADAQLAATQELLGAASEAAGRAVFEKKGLLRLATNEQQLQDFSEAAEGDEKLEWWPAERCQEAIPDLNPCPGVWIPEAIQVDSEAYLKGLWMACQLRGVQWESQKVEDLNELDSFDKVVLAAGYGIKAFPEFAELELRAVRGQVLYLAWPGDKAPLPFPLNSGGHLLMRPDGKSVLAGATYERDWSDTEVSSDRAVEEVCAKIRLYLPLIDDLELLDTQWGLRAYTPQHQPILRQWDERTWLFTALGSKGLLWHAQLAQQLRSMI